MNENLNENEIINIYFSLQYLFLRISDEIFSMNDTVIATVYKICPYMLKNIVCDGDQYYGSTEFFKKASNEILIFYKKVIYIIFFFAL